MKCTESSTWLVRLSINSVTSVVADTVYLASSLISLAATANPFPASRALAASIVSLRASKSV